jgi:hypothetical protein
MVRLVPRGKCTLNNFFCKFLKRIFNIPFCFLLTVKFLRRGIVKVNLSYLKGKRQTWELTSSGWVEKGGGDGRFRVPLVDLSGRENLFGFSLLFHEKSEVMTKWSLLTSDDDREAEYNGTSCTFPCQMTNASSYEPELATHRNSRSELAPTFRSSVPKHF